MTERVCRWGILGAAGIAHKNWQSIRNATNCTLVMAASRSLERAEQFVGRCQAHSPFPHPPRAVDDYEQVLASDEVDAVYLPLPTGVRGSWAIRAAQAGKHVLCEKPAGRDAAEVKRILAACRESNVQFMDGVMFMHSRRMEQLRSVLEDDEGIGQIKRITSQFSLTVPDDFLRDNIRVHSDLEPAGCLGDLGWYNLRFTLWVMKERLPQQVSARTLCEHTGADSLAAVPTELVGELFYSDGISAGFYCSFLAEHQQWANISGTQGAVQIRDFVLPFYGSELSFDVARAVFRVQGCDFNMEEHTRRVAVHEYSNSHESSQETNMFRNFARLALSGRPDPTWGEIAWKTQRLLDACLESASRGGQPVEL